MHISYSDHAGGASRIAYRIYFSIKENFPNSYMYVLDKGTKDNNVIFRNTISNKIRSQIGNIFSSRFNNMIGNKDE